MDLDYVNVNDLSDAELVALMRKCNYEKFKTLVRMHLSFELELNTDEFDLPCHEIVYEDKGKLKKWNRLSKKQRHMGNGGSMTSCSAAVKGSASAGNSPIDGLYQQIDAGFLFHLKEFKEFLLLEKNLTQEGIFRKTGSASRQNDLRMQIQHDKPLNLEASGYSAHDCATVFKGYLADLPEPLLTNAHYPAHLQIAPLCIGSALNTAASSSSSKTKPPNPERIKREQHLLNSIQLLLLLLPEDNRELLQHIVEMLHAVAAQEQYNKMTPENLATLFAPHLICPRKLPPEVLHYVAKKMSSIITYVIIKGEEIFEMPAKLSTDIRAYFLERKRKKTMSPEQTLDDSISDISTVNTVYTFVDREKTAAAHTATHTDTELAQLYAHIQTLPESSKKRRLIKQFNKQNGQGTPLQLVIMNRLKNSEATRSARSISDSIKKHIFHKGIMSRTPKRNVATTTTNMPVIETPNFTKTKNPKLRVLFQSPVTACPSMTTINSSTTTTTMSTFKPLATTLSVASSSSSMPSSSLTTTNNITPYNSIKSHPLQKSISSTLLLMNATEINSPASSSSRSGTSSSSCNSSCCSSICDGFSSEAQQQHEKSHNMKGRCSISAPVSRQVSSDLSTNNSYLAPCSASGSAPYSLAHADSANSSFCSMPPSQACLDAAACCVTPLKLISEAAKHFMDTMGGGGGIEKKTVAWDEEHLLAIEEISNPCTPIQTNSLNLKSRHKSEPNLNHLLNRQQTQDNATAELQEITTPISKGGSGSGSSKLFTRKLIKGVSLNNLRFPFNTPESTKRLVRSVSSTLKRRSSDDPYMYLHSYVSHAGDMAAGVVPLLEDVDDTDLDDDTFEDAPEDHIDSEDDVVDGREHGAAIADINDNTSSENAACSGGSISNELPSCSGVSRARAAGIGAYRNLDLAASTPSLLLGRRSMSPITKSAQRMPKAMQESIMTPRSRKPVMVLTTTHSSTEQNQMTACQADLASFREQDEEDSMERPQPPILHNENATSLGGYADILRRQHLLQANQSFVQQINAANVNAAAATDIDAAVAAGGVSSIEDSSNSNSEAVHKLATHEELTNNFKKYLLRRSVLTASPVDSSFSSQPDDFSSTQEIEDLDEAQLSPSLLYCLDGNQPEQSSDDSTSNDHNVNDDTALHEIEYNTNAAKNTNSGSSNRINRLSTNPFVIQNNARKRAATNELEKITTIRANTTTAATSITTTTTSTTPIMTTTTTQSSSSSAMSSRKDKVAEKENYDEHMEGYLNAKKLLISEYTGETSF